MRETDAKRRCFTVLAACAIACFAAACSPTPKPDPPNIILIIGDDHGWPYFGFMDDPIIATPHLDALAVRGVQGGSIPVAPGISPGSGPGHLGLFGYDPLKYMNSRGALEALGIEAELLPGDVAARGNFCTVDDSGSLVDRRAGRVGGPAKGSFVRGDCTVALPAATVAGRCRGRVVRRARAARTR